MKKTAFIFHPAFLDHDTGPSHPESPERLRAIQNELVESGLLDRMDQPPPPEHPREGILDWIGKVHRPSHIQRIQSLQKLKGLNYLDGDTPVSPRSYDAAMLAVDGVLTAADAVVSGRVSNAFCAVRPPGHHAESNRSMGFCLFNNIAITARYIQQAHRLERILIIDWDVHHGNGTQEIFYDDPTVFYFSVHQWPLYPGTGLSDERGEGKGEGFTLNCPLPPGKGDLEYISVFEKILKPAVDAFQPSFILISAGFDAHRDDPLAGMRVTEAGFREMTRWAMQWAEQYSRGRIVSTLEGGYDLDALARSVAAHMDQLSLDGGGA